MVKTEKLVCTVGFITLYIYIRKKRCSYKGVGKYFVGQQSGIFIAFRKIKLE
jgi:hypothetical protein